MSKSYISLASKSLFIGTVIFLTGSYSNAADEKAAEGSDKSIQFTETQLKEAFEMTDTNKDKLLSSEELDAFYAQQSISSSHNGADSVKAMDKDMNGSVSEEEFMSFVPHKADAEALNTDSSAMSDDVEADSMDSQK